MTIRINKKIKGYQVVGNDAPAVAQPVAPAGTPAIAEPVAAEIIQMHEKLERPEILIGATYKIKSPLVEHALYITINDIVLNAGTQFEMRRPFEIFINSKNMDHFQWIVALTRIMSAVFRKGGDVTFLVEELKAVFDPRGGYFKAGGVYMPSIVAELGNIIEAHLKMIGLIKDPELSEPQRKLIAEKRAAYARKSANAKIITAGEMGGAMVAPDADGANLASKTSSSRRRPGSSTSDATADDVRAETSTDAAAFPPGAAMCGKCNTQALVLLDGCRTCLNCGYSKCG